MIQWLESHQIPCAYKLIFGVECPACGIQRALISLLKGNIIESIWYWPPLFPTILAIGLIFSSLMFKKPQRKYITHIVIADFVLILMCYFLKLSGLLK